MTIPLAGAVIVAAGASRRMAGADKVWAIVGDRPVLAHTVAVFEAHPAISAVVIVVAPGHEAAAADWATRLGWAKLVAIVPGGARRRDSALAGILALPLTTDLILIHDGARPLVTPAIISAGLAAAQATGAATAAVPVKDTIKRVDAAGLVIETPDRAALVAVQTPQVFRRDLILAAHRAAPAEFDATDDALLAERAGHPVHTFPGAYANLKITTPEDLAILAALWRRES